MMIVSKLIFIPIIDVYTVSQDTITVHGAYSLDESLVPDHGRKVIHKRMPRQVKNFDVLKFLNAINQKLALKTVSNNVF